MKLLNLFKKISVREIAKRCETDQKYIELAEKQEEAYKSPPGYINWPVHLRVCFAASGTLSMIDCYKSSDLIGVKVAELAREMLTAFAPARFLTAEMCEAFKQTPVPTLTPDVLEVLPYMHIMLPRNSVFDHQGDEVISLLVKAGELYPQTTEKEEVENREACKKYFPDAISTPVEIRGSRGIQVATITGKGSNCWQEFVDEKAKSWHNENVKYLNKSGYEHKETEIIMRVAINSLLIHLYEPELIKTDKPVRPSGTGFASKQGTGPMGVTWIGRGFRYCRENNSSSKQKNTTGSIRAHWRRGHWHSYLVNKGRSDRIVKWVRPVYVKGSIGEREDEK